MRAPKQRQGRAPKGAPPKWAHHPFDRMFKFIAEHDPAGLLAWLVEVLDLPPTTLVESKRSKELVESEQEVDVLWVVEVEKEQELLHLEAELKDEQGRMGQRLAAYALQLYARDQLPVHSIVLYIKRKATVSLPPFVIGTKRQTYLRLDFDAIKLWEVAPETVLSRAVPYLWPLAGLMAGMTPARVVEIAGQIVAAVPAGGDQKELVGMLVVLAGIQLSKHEIEDAIRRNPMIDEIWKESSAAQVLLEEGEARGRAEGREQGRAEEARRMAQLVLERRFGALAPDLLEALNQAQEATLEELVVENTLPLEQVRTRLGLE